jgi:hypothetical protein
MRSRATVIGALLIAAVSVSFTSCTKSPPADDLSPAERHISGWHDVWILDMLPECEYVVTGTVEARGCSLWRATSFLKELAWRGGGEAIIHVVSGETHDRYCPRDMGFEMRGVAIRFTDPECMH